MEQVRRQRREGRLLESSGKLRPFHLIALSQSCCCCLSQLISALGGREGGLRCPRIEKIRFLSWKSSVRFRLKISNLKCNPMKVSVSLTGSFFIVPLFLVDLCK
ncbi:hypothetical protein OPV22_024424 [Ensete ventricosum]|uniref:Uncharacterized protein n=1 Tax=Ensete ventricosum TaxID=4639 RepID=A0AAV8P8M1_ENSVE|nr:hypothetical protein OPV22_024424 [Ensete ventricosum]